MKALCLSFFCILLLLLAGDLNADTPDLKGSVAIESDGSPISLLTPCPTVVDWNNDGAKDLVVGQFHSGNIYLYINTGSDLNQVFGAGTKIESNGTPITTSYG
jgi:hypothetical protein